ncbi:NAD-dependent epimerase/dehydratase family protein [Pedobacter sp. P351]|uniref:NAD-dependent epimerase/dehydratase family protein n=1 Tax=Pedobacter superstes TaxID=3133441 RepID=UPI0030B1A38B
MNIGITGATGFVGININSYLTRFNHTCQTISRTELNGGKVDFGAIKAIIHLAGKVHNLKESDLLDDYYRINFELTRSLYDSWLQSESSVFIFISTVAAVAGRVEGILTEDWFPSPITHYGKSKLMAEQYIQNQPLPEGKSYYIFRPCMIHGPNNKGNLNLLYNFVSMGIPYPLASFSNKRSFLSVENLCFIIKEILGRTDIPSGIYNVADDEPLSTTEVVTLLAQAQITSPRLLNIPQKIIKLLAKIGDKLHLPLTTERLQKLTENFVVSNYKIKAVLKKDLPLSSREGMLKTARSFKNLRS